MWSGWGDRTSLGDNRWRSSRPPLECVGRLVAQRRMPALPIVEHLDVVEERGAGLGMRAEGAPSQHLALQGCEEALGHRVVVAVADRAHRAADPRRLALVPEEQRGVLAAMVGVVNHTDSR